MCATVLLMGTLASTAASTSTVDQQQPVIDVTVGALAIGGASEQKLAQTITAGVSGALTMVRFPVACNTGNLFVEVQGVTASGVPDGTTLASQTIAGSSLRVFP
jgi:hypothetical protein